MAAVVVARGEHWKAVLLIAPVYLTYRTYEVFVGRLADQAGGFSSPVEFLALRRGPPLASPGCSLHRPKHR